VLEHSALTPPPLLDVRWKLLQYLSMYPRAESPAYIADTSSMTLAAEQVESAVF
jgi:hypothetical protein